MIMLAKDTSGGAVAVFNEKNTVIFSRPGKLVGFTSSTVSIKDGNAIITFNEQGRQIAVTPA